MPKQTVASPRASKAAVRLKSRLMEMSIECFEPMTFGELKTGERFIFFPLPGDNHGHGGFKGTHYIFIKTKHDMHGFGIPTGIAVNASNGNESYDPHEMLVIRVE